MLTVDAQIHLWEKGTPSAHHRQEPYSAEQAIAGMDEAGVDRALIHPVLWDPDSNELAIEAVRKYHDRFAIMGWFYLDDPNRRDIVARWKERPGCSACASIPTSGTRSPGREPLEPSNETPAVGSHSVELLVTYPRAETPSSTAFGGSRPI